MDSDVTQSAAFFKAWAWAEAHRKQLLIGVAGLLVAGLVVGFVVAQKHQKQVAASEALSLVLIQNATQSRTGVDAAQRMATEAGAYEKVAADYSDTSAAERALLMAGGRYFTAGKFAEAYTEFQKFLRQNPGSEFAGMAALGAATALDAQGKTEEAIKAYRDITERRAKDPIAPQAKLSLARLFEAQGNLTQARDTYRQLAQSGMSSAAQEAMLQLQLLMRKHPELMEAVQPPPTAPVALSEGTNAVSTNTPVLQTQP